jgi:PAS domain S-box-containing protein
MGAKRSLRVVIVEDSATDAELVMRELRKDGDHIELEHVDSSSSLLAALERGPCDVVISDYHLPGFSGPDALQLVRSRNADVPFILVSGTIGEEIAVQMLKAGADDYLLKGNLTRLLPSVNARLQEAEERRARRRSEQELRASESLKGAILESSLDCIVTMDHEGRIVEFNPAAERTFGYTRDQALGKLMADLIIPPRSRDAHRRGLAHYLATGEGPVLGKRLELEAIRADGSEFPIELAITPIKSRSTPLFTGFIRDITQRKEAEAKINRLNRVYAVLSGINGMIVRVRDRDELFREACRIAIELGQFRLIYIGLVDEAAQQICPVAWAGDHPDLAQRRRPLGPSAQGREGTASQAVRSKRPVIENNITAESRTLTYPEEVLRHGYRSVGSFPLVVEEKAVGVVGIFAAEPGYFDAEEVKLLEELAGDIAFALDHIEQEEKVRRLTRVQAVLSGINAAIVRIRDRQRLLEEACRIAVQAGQLRLAWIGIVDPKREVITPAAFSGIEQGWLRIIRLSTREDSGQFGMAGRAIRDRSPVVSNDLPADERALFRKESAERGYRSLAMIPLVVHGEAFGVLGLHASEPGFFNEEELKLLTELAGDIAFGIEHIEQEEKVEHLTRVYAVLSGINAIIVRVRDREELYREACRVAVEAGKFRYARLDIVDDEQKALKPVAIAGDERAYQELIRNRLSLRDDAPGGHGIAATAVREKRAVVVDDTQTDPRVRFKKEHIERGIRSIVALPLMIGGEPMGAFSLHAGETGFFDDDEMKLLRELAGDISFAMEHIEKSEQVDYLAYYDSLTGLANRTLFHERVVSICARL